jgi:dTDP-glucose 4,6-dehydratase
MVERFKAERIRAVQLEDVAAIIERDLPWDRFSGQRVLVTGASGFLGGYLTRTLVGLHPAGRIAEPVHVLALVRSVSKARQQLADQLDCRHLEIIECDLRDPVLSDVGDLNFVLHAASQASPRFYGTDPVGTILPNAIGTAALLKALSRSSKPEGFLFVSSSEVYGSPIGNVRLNETRYSEVDPMIIRSCYAEAKRFGEALCAAWHKQYQIPTFIVRPFHTYGPGLQEDDGRVFADFAFNVVRGENIRMASEGLARRAFCYVTDAIAGFFTVMLNGRPATAYNVANPSGDLSVGELAEMLSGLFPERRIRVDIDASSARDTATSYILPDVSRLAALGWQPKVSPSAGFQRMIEAYELINA